MLPAPNRLRDNRTFRTVYAQGKSHVSSYAVIYVMPRDDVNAATRFGFVVSKKQGKAVVRNRIKRRLSEAVRLNLAQISETPCDVIFVGRSRLKAAAWNEIETAVCELLRRGGIWRGERQSQSPGETNE